jgi:hypothetical protein
LQCSTLMQELTPWLSVLLWEKRGVSNVTMKDLTPLFHVQLREKTVQADPLLADLTATGTPVRESMVHLPIFQLQPFFLSRLQAIALASFLHLP